MRKTGCMSATRFLFVLKWKGKVSPMESTNEFLGTERIGKLMQKYAIPCIISLLVGALYNIVDQIFIANASYLGSYGNAANTVVFPLTVVRWPLPPCTSALLHRSWGLAQSGWACFAVLSVVLAALISAFECCLSGAAVGRRIFSFWVLTFNS